MPEFDDPNRTIPTMPVAPYVPYSEPGDRDYMERILRGAIAQANSSGDLPHGQIDRIWRCAPPNGTMQAIKECLPSGAKIERSLGRPRHETVLVRAPDFLIAFEVKPDWIKVEVAAKSPFKAMELIEHLRRHLEVLPPPSRKVATMTWSRFEGPRYGAHRRVRWSSIRCNYPASVATELDHLMRMNRRCRRSGKVILFEGDAGTGKTWAIRALMSAWARWASIEIIADAQTVFDDPAYMMELLYHDGTACPRLFVCEDVDDLVTNRHDDSMSRLLGLTDGLVGGDQDVMLLISTNAQIRRLPPALVRPGRCLAKIEFKRFSVEEARTMLNGSGPCVTAPVTLTELLELKGVIRQIRTDEPPPPTGTYL
jgi:hypothetical protein